MKIKKVRKNNGSFISNTTNNHLFLLIVLLVVVIILGIKIIITIDKINEIVDDIRGKVESLNNILEL